MPVERIARHLGRQNSLAAQVHCRPTVEGDQPHVSAASFGSHWSNVRRSREGLAAGWSIRAIAQTLGRSPSTVCREVNANGGPKKYLALVAERAAAPASASGQDVGSWPSVRLLRGIVERKLEAKWSPQQISAWLASQYPDRPELQVSHETIYQSLFVQSRERCAKSSIRACAAAGLCVEPRPMVNANHTGQGKLKNMVTISERPAEVADRAVPGHWEGDLIFGKKMTSIGTLVERHSRYVILLKLPNGHGAEAVRKAMTKRILTLPAQLRLFHYLGSGQGDCRARPVHRGDMGLDPKRIAGRWQLADCKCRPLDNPPNPGDAPITCQPLFWGSGVKTADRTLMSHSM